MPVNSTHPEYDENITAWSRARDVVAGEDAVKAGGQKYLARLDAQTDEEYGAYKARASFFNATARTGEGYVGLIFRRPPFVKLPESDSALSRALSDLKTDADMLGKPLVSYSKDVNKSTSKWIKTKGSEFAKFHWLSGYGQSNFEQAVKYVNQAEHHRRKTFGEEYREFVVRHEVPFDERYIWISSPFQG